MSVDSIYQPLQSVEGHACTPQELEIKRASGARYLASLQPIIQEFPSAHVYETPTDLEHLAARLTGVVELDGYEVEDASARFDDVDHCTVLAREWARLVYDARHRQRVYVVRRTASNCAALLALQRIEHLRGACTEFSPLAVAILVRDENHFYVRHELRSPEELDSEVAAIVHASSGLGPCVNLPEEAYREQMQALDEVIDGISESPVVEVLKTDEHDLAVATLALQLDDSGAPEGECIGADE